MQELYEKKDFLINLNTADCDSIVTDVPNLILSLATDVIDGDLLIVSKIS